MRKIACLIALFAALTWLTACFGGSSQDFDPTKESEKHLIEPGEEFVDGSYINVDGVEILYNSGVFSIKNDRTDDIIITLSVVGIKPDGTYTLLQMPAFSGVDKTQYENDFAKNGWAVEQHTNRVRSGETLNAVASIFDFSSSNSDYPAPDIDGDGYYDVFFTIHPQISPDRITTSAEDPKSEIYKLKS